MKGKYVKSKKKKQGKLWLLLLCLALAAIGGLVWFLSSGRDNQPDLSLGGETSQAETTEALPAPETEPAVNQTIPDAQIQVFDPISLPSGLVITRADKYAGVYMEDGSDQIVSDVMMLIVRNTTENDLQLARIQLEYPELTAHFEVTNLPAGASAVLLEKNRSAYPKSALVGCEESDVFFFAEPMTTLEDVLEITAMDGALSIKNISGQDISETIYVYFKNSGSDLFYGGITYRTRLEGGLKADEAKQIMTSHFSENGSVIVMVTVGK